MKELILKNKRLNLNTVLKMNRDNEVISSTIFFDEPIEISIIFPARGILFGIPQQPQLSDVSMPSKFPGEREKLVRKNLPNWLVKDLKRRKDGKA